ncbi:MAG: hypothetical protein C0396_02915 [Anaerolinea sp.]|nr:hypothetical protein [Anaerolinea sp.]
MAAKLHFLAGLKPGVRKIWLQFSAGLVWLGGGLMLIGFASRWLKLVDISTRLLLVPAGVLLAAGIYALGFSRLAKKNINRISDLKDEKVCLFAFQAWKSYPLIAFMSSLGIYLRVYSPIPKFVLATLYLGIGGGLFSASLHYFANFTRAFQAKSSEG